MGLITSDIIILAGDNHKILFAPFSLTQHNANYQSAPPRRNPPPLYPHPFQRLPPQTHNLPRRRLSPRRFRLGSPRRKLSLHLRPPKPSSQIWYRIRPSKDLSRLRRWLPREPGRSAPSTLPEPAPPIAILQL